MTPDDLDVFLAEQRRADAIRALSMARSEVEVATIERRVLDLGEAGEDDASVAVERWQ